MTRELSIWEIERSEYDIEIFYGKCPECLAMGRRGEDITSASLYVYHSKEWVHNFVIDCDDRADHVVQIEGAWTNPVIKEVLARFGLTKRKVIAAHAKRMKLEAKEAQP